MRSAQEWRSRVRPTSLHPVVKRLDKKLERAPPRQGAVLFIRGYYGTVLKVTVAARARAMHLLNNLFWHLEQSGHARRRATGRRENTQQWRDAIPAQYLRAFGPAAGAPIAYVEQDWSTEEWTRGLPDRRDARRRHERMRRRAPCPMRAHPLGGDRAHRLHGGRAAVGGSRGGRGAGAPVKMGLARAGSQGVAKVIPPPTAVGVPPVCFPQQ